jgi:small lipoprotein (TIGR04454 family)
MRSIASLSLLILCAVGCGRPATRAECDEIVGRIAELELRARGLTGDNADEVKATKDALEKTTLRDCVGRRISDKAMSCVRSAKTTQQIVGECF